MQNREAKNKKMLRKSKLISAFCTSMRTTYASIEIVHKPIDVGILRKGLLGAIPQVEASLFVRTLERHGNEYVRT